jgi:hypothetical protein
MGRSFHGFHKLLTVLPELFTSPIVERWREIAVAGAEVYILLVELSFARSLSQKQNRHPSAPVSFTHHGEPD